MTLTDENPYRAETETERWPVAGTITAAVWPSRNPSDIRFAFYERQWEIRRIDVPISNIVHCEHRTLWLLAGMIVGATDPERGDAWNARADWIAGGLFTLFKTIATRCPNGDAP